MGRGKNTFGELVHPPKSMASFEQRKHALIQESTAAFKQYKCDDTACALNCKDQDFSLNTCLHVDDGSSAMCLTCVAGANGLQGLTWTNANCSGLVQLKPWMLDLAYNPIPLDLSPTPAWIASE